MSLFSTDSYTIEKVYSKNHTFVVQLQRLPQISYPTVTELSLAYFNFSFWVEDTADPDFDYTTILSSFTFDSWISEAQPLIDSELSTIDSTFSGNPHVSLVNDSAVLRY